MADRRSTFLKKTYPEGFVLKTKKHHKWISKGPTTAETTPSHSNGLMPLFPLNQARPYENSHLHSTPSRCFEDGGIPSQGPRGTGPREGGGLGIFVVEAVAQGHRHRTKHMGARVQVTPKRVEESRGGSVCCCVFLQCVFSCFCLQGRGPMVWGSETRKQGPWFEQVGVAKAQVYKPLPLSDVNLQIL